MSVNIPKISTSTTQCLISESKRRLNGIGKMTLENVSVADEETRRFLREVTPARLKELAKMNCYAADKIKAEFDKKYGENNYVLIAVGRSLSSIAELLSQKGVDVKIIPLSGLRKNSVDNVRKDALHTYKTFLVQKGLSKTDLVKNAEKTYILIDYTHYSTSLKRAEQLLKKNELLGDAKNLISIPVKEILDNDYTERGFEKLFEYSRFKDYSYVGKLHICELENVYKQCAPERIKEFQGNITNYIRKLFWFNVFDSIKEGNYKDIMPRGELDAIYKHYLSQKAVRNYVRREMAKQEKVAEFFKPQK